MENNLLQIIQHYKINNQQRKFVEECYELMEAITQREYQPKDKKPYELIEFEKAHIIEEIADIEVMLKQFQYYYDISDEDIEEIMKYKIQRQIERIKKDGN